MSETLIIAMTNLQYLYIGVTLKGRVVGDWNVKLYLYIKAMSKKKNLRIKHLERCGVYAFSCCLRVENVGQLSGF